MFLQAVAAGEVDFQEELGSAMIISRVVGILEEAAVMAGMNIEGRVNFQGDQKVQLDVLERDEGITMETGEVVIKAV